MVSQWSRAVPTDRFTVFSSRKDGTYFFSTSHCQPLGDGHADFVPSTGGLPMSAVPRAAIPEGVIRTIEEYIAVFHSDKKEIRNPDPSFQPFLRQACQ